MTKFEQWWEKEEKPMSDLNEQLDHAKKVGTTSAAIGRAIYRSLQLEQLYKHYYDSTGESISFELTLYIDGGNSFRLTFPFPLSLADLEKAGLKMDQLLDTLVERNKIDATHEVISIVESFYGESEEGKNND